MPACFTSADGRKPDGEHFVYPTGVLLSPGGTALYVANSDFDLQFSGGSVQAIDVISMRQAVSAIPVALAAGEGRQVMMRSQISAICLGLSAQ